MKLYIDPLLIHVHEESADCLKFGQDWCDRCLCRDSNNGELPCFLIRITQLLRFAILLQKIGTRKRLSCFLMIHQVETS